MGRLSSHTRAIAVLWGVRFAATLVRLWVPAAACFLASAVKTGTTYTLHTVASYAHVGTNRDDDLC